MNFLIASLLLLVLPTTHSLRITTCGPVPNAAIAEYEPTLLSTGWDVLTITTNQSVPDTDQAYAAGFVEGLATSRRICDHWTNMMALYPNGTQKAQPLTPALTAFFEDNMKWMEQMTKQFSTSSKFWYQVNLQWTQWKGLYDGFATTGTCLLSKAELLSLGSQGDLFDLNSAVTKKDWSKMTPRQFRDFFQKKTHCSALVKLAADLSDIWFSHTSWYTYTSTTRIFKHYKFNYNDESTRAKVISMSSYPASLSSFDDFHLMDNGMVSIETSIGVFNYSLYNNNTIKPQSLLYSFRVMVANRMAKDSPDWATQFAMYNSGTYNNQWLVLDLSKFTPGKDIKPDTFWVVEQMPGMVEGHDQSTLLGYGYFPSYNVPMYTDIFNSLGYPGAVAMPGGAYMSDYQTCVRANIFRRDQAKVVDVATMQNIMEYNDYQNDPFSMKDPGFAIASRDDLDPISPRCGGGYDNKVSSYTMWGKGMLILARNGPTPQQGVFSFDTTKAACGAPGHVTGLPRVYNFSYVLMQP